jgi:DNA-binding LacI/PurR family transcriptional regulator
MNKNLRANCSNSPIDSRTKSSYHVTVHVTVHMNGHIAGFLPFHSMHRSRPTIRDVATRAQVSYQTVSRVINADPRVAPATRARVETAIQSLGYRPNAIARSMARGRTHTLACLAPNLTDYTFACVIEGAETAARQHGYFLLSASAPDPTEFVALTEQLVVGRRADGLMVINPYADERYTHIPPNIPTVYVGARPRDETVDSVALDDEGAARMATQHLIDLSHRRIALVHGPLAEDCTQDRNTGYQMALRLAGIVLDPALVVEGDWSATSGYAAACRLLAGRVSFTALFAQNDRMAVGAVRSLREAGKHIPQDIAVIGFDDIPLASYFDPPLTTMRQDLFGIGREAARLLIRALEYPNAPHEHLRLPAELVVRHSTQIVREGR